MCSLFLVLSQLQFMPKQEIPSPMKKCRERCLTLWEVPVGARGQFYINCSNSGGLIQAVNQTPAHTHFSDFLVDSLCLAGLSGLRLPAARSACGGLSNSACRRSHSVRSILMRA